MTRRAASGGVRAALLLAVGAACYANALGGDFVWDDRLTGPAAPLGVAALVTQRAGAYYRPVVMLSFALERGLWGAVPAGFHVANVLYHLGVAWLLGTLVEGLGVGAGAALASALVFAAHPVQSEAVTYVSGRTDVLAALFVLTALLAWRRAWRATDAWAIASAAGFALALLCKEAAVAIPLVLLVPGAHPAGHPPRPVLPLAAAAIWLVAWAASGEPGLRVPGLAHRLPAIGVAALTYGRLLLWPADLHLERFVPVPGWSLAAGLAVWVVLAALGLGLLRLGRRVPGGPVLLGLAVLAYAPGSGVVPAYPAIADRALFTPEHFLYLPLLGLAPLVVAGVASARPRGATVLLAVVLAAWVVVIVARNRDWRDEETLFRHTVAFDPPAARVWFNLGNLALAGGRLDEAERLYRAALAREPGDGAAHLNLGITLQRRGALAEAEEEYRRAVASDPHLAERLRRP